MTKHTPRTITLESDPRCRSEQCRYQYERVEGLRFLERWIRTVGEPFAANPVFTLRLHQDVSPGMCPDEEGHCDYFRKVHPVGPPALWLHWECPGPYGLPSERYTVNPMAFSMILPGDIRAGDHVRIDVPAIRAINVSLGYPLRGTLADPDLT